MDGRIAALAFCMAFLACGAGPGAGLLTGYASHSTYSGFAEPHPSFSLSPAGITFQGDSGSEAVHVQADDFAVYRYGYVSLDGKEWERFELSGNALGGDWLNGTVSGDISMEPSDFGLTQERLSTQMNFVVVYSCSRTGGTWDCHDGWQIVRFDARLETGDYPWMEGIVSWWKLDGNAGDSVGGNHGDILGPVAETSDCVTGGCYHFDGIDDYIEIPDHDSLTAETGHTLSAWIKLQGNDEIDSIFNKWAQGPDVDEYLFAVEENHLFYGWNTGHDQYYTPSFNDVSDDTSLSLNRWYHVAVVRNGNLISFYIDGALAGESSPADQNEFFNSDVSLRIGGQGRGDRSRFIEGYVDEVMLWGRALTSQEIAGIYQYLSGGSSDAECGNGLVELGETCDGNCPVTCDDSDPCTADTKTGSAGDCDLECINAPVSSCTDGDGCCPSSCSHENDDDCSVAGTDEIDVIGPHEFWTHENAENGEYIGYVKFFDMDEDVDPVFSIVSGNSGTFDIVKTAESPRDLFPSGLITVSDNSALIPGTTYELGVRIHDSATGKDSTAPVVIHVAEDDDVVYVDSEEGNGGNGSYASPYNEIGDIGDWNYEGGKVYLFRRGSTFYDHIWFSHSTIDEESPVVFGAYGSGDRPIFDGTTYGSSYGNTGMLIGRASDSFSMSHIYAQNLEFSNWQYNGILNSASQNNHHMTFLDLYVHHVYNTVWWLWAKDYHEFDNMHITITNCEVSEGGIDPDESSASGTKWYAGGIHVYNFYTHDNTGNGMRFIDAPDKICMGCVAHDNGGHGLQFKSGDLHVEHFKSYNNGGNNVEMYHDPNSEDPDTHYNFLVRDGVIYGGDHRGMSVWGAIENVLIENLTVYGNTEEGMRVSGYLDTTRNITIRDSIIYNNGAQGIMMGSVSSSYGYDYRILDNRIADNGAEGIYARYAHGVTITGNTITGNGGEAIRVDTGRTTGVEISGNVIA